MARILREASSSVGLGATGPPVRTESESPTRSTNEDSDCGSTRNVEVRPLVFGSEKRGVEIPRIKQNFESNVPGLYIVGELGGMGLIRNAFEQGRQCVEGIAKEGRGPKDALDLAIIGCGPAGLATALHSLHQGLRFVVLEKEDVGGTVRNYPRKKIVMTSPVTVPGFGKLVFKEIVKERLIGLWEDIVRRTGLRVNTGETVSDIVRGKDGCFTVTSSRGAYRARRQTIRVRSSPSLVRWLRLVTGIS